MKKMFGFFSPMFIFHGGIIQKGLCFQNFKHPGPSDHAFDEFEKVLL